MASKTVQLTVFRCEMCGKALVAGRVDRKTCSDACRKRLSYHRKRIPVMKNHAVYALTELLLYMKSTETQELAQRAIAEVLLAAKQSAREARVQEVR